MGPTRARGAVCRCPVKVGVGGGWSERRRTCPCEHWVYTEEMVPPPNTHTRKIAGPPDRRTAPGSEDHRRRTDGALSSISDVSGIPRPLHTVHNAITTTQ